MQSWRDKGRRSGRTGHIGGRGGVIETRGAKLALGIIKRKSKLYHCVKMSNLL